MEAADTLATIAQISLGLAGFAGVVVSFDKINADLSRVDAFRLMVLLSMSMGALILSLFPFGLHNLGLDKTQVWKISSIFSSLFSIGFVLWFGLAVKRIRAIAPEIFNTSSTLFYYLGHIINAWLQTSNVFGVWQVSPQGIYVFGLIWLLLIGLLQFWRMLFVQRHSDGPIN